MLVFGVILVHIFPHPDTFYAVYVLALFTKFSAVAANYYGKTKRYFKVRMYEDLGISTNWGEELGEELNHGFTTKEHLFLCNHSPDFEDFSVLDANNNDIKVTLMESLLINRDHPLLNKNKQSVYLELFDN